MIGSEAEGKTWRHSLAGLFEYMAERMHPMVWKTNTHAEGWLKLDATHKLLAQVALEPNWRSNDNEELTLACQLLLGKLRDIHVALYRMETEYARAIGGPKQHHAVMLASPGLQTLSAEVKRYAQALQSEPDSIPAIDSRLSQLMIDMQQGSVGIETFRNRSLLLRIGELVALFRSGPGWPDDNKRNVSGV